MLPTRGLLVHVDAAMKWLVYAILAVLVGGAWTLFSMKGSEEKELKQKIDAIYEEGDPEGEAAKLKSRLQTVQGERTMNGVLLAVLSSGLVGTFFVVQILPVFVQRATHAVYDSGEMVEKDVMHDARSLLAQGAYEESIAAFRTAAASEPTNRLPWVEMAKIFKDHLHQPHAAVEVLREALESHEWPVNDAAYLLFRLAELYDECMGDRNAAVAIMQQVIDQFPSTRHSANARHKLTEWSTGGTVAQREAEERAFLERMNSNNQS